MGSYIETELIINHKDTELRLGLPGSDDEQSCNGGSIVRSNKRSFSPETSVEEESISKSSGDSNSTTTSDRDHDQDSVQPTKVQVVGWPPIRSFRKNSLQQNKVEDGNGMYVKVSMAGAPYLRKIDLKVYKSYSELLKVLENMFKCTFGEYSEREGYNGSEYAPTYEDKDGDWMLVGDVPWNMFISSCKRLKIVKGSEAKGLACL
ncbi:putative transcription factor interactor and regulator AUX-IAA family [Medicago truncatula]|uniref:Auxin-induced protein n=1 Tax=Medicago truncatula TaxID=3880 RepID=A0A396HA94_MEDTR|nr:auxin-induced protein 22E-like [Medicago truncatula]RHN48145.1 putative transcription factor interactor and regulator AUX-IAA family [Medicago truncatula]